MDQGCRDPMKLGLFSAAVVTQTGMRGVEDERGDRRARHVPSDAHQLLLTPSVFLSLREGAACTLPFGNGRSVVLVAAVAVVVA